MKKATTIALGVTAALGAAAATAIYTHWNAFVPIAAMGLNYWRYLDAPAGVLTVETAPDFDTAPRVADTRAAPPDDGSWPSYNKTLASDRFSSLSEIDRANVGRLKVLCTYDTGRYTGFNSGLVMVRGALLFATEHDTFSIDPLTCRENWRKRESYAPATPQGVNRGVAYLDGRVFRGTQDGRVIAYDFTTGARLWETAIADPKKSETAPAAPIAWNGLVFIGNAGGDFKGVKGRMYALDAATGRIAWEFYLVPKQPGDSTRGPQGASPLDASSWNQAPGSPISGGATWTSYTLDPDSGLLYVPGGNPAPDFAAALRGGDNLYSNSVVVLDARTGAYRTHFKIVGKDWHDWDVSGAPALVATASGRRVMLVAPKDGHLYGFDLDTKERLYRVPVTKIENADVPFSADRSVHFCPGSVGGAEWNGPAYDPQNNLVMIGEVQWCTTVRTEPEKEIESAPKFAPWSGEDSLDPFNMWGRADPVFQWAGWLTAVDADSGRWRWRAKTNYPVQSGVTPTAGGVVFFGDMGGNFYALDADTGGRLWGAKIGGAVGGGVITFATPKGQRVAVATGLTEILWPTEITTAKVSILGVAGD
ncbi:PQQ-binding-like beta-propeller repeat protein [Methylosinus sp. KRF6]|uniref:outer membrane protein assembly factor BamB family protein n=1 Tax=Methylosinus sp. KRF6 TaxID=2846853 RepID=UPI001C0C076F|nr:PQQ-binding-like beta-propeller repeat protein [Methylosinus sp. KRF6]MBU3887900.1 PQQ-binding-like beta-propeller repeat protein [Methylosinus sp. KRF6]